MYRCKVRVRVRVWTCVLIGCIANKERGKVRVRVWFCLGVRLGLGFGLVFFFHFHKSNIGMLIKKL